MKAIKVLDRNTNITLFIIEGFKEKEVSLGEIMKITVEHFRYLYLDEEVNIYKRGNDFLVITKLKSFSITWSWITSYSIRNTI